MDLFHPLEKFTKLKPPKLDPLEADEWIIQMDKLFEAMLCPEEENIQLDTFTFKGEAEYWWKTAKRVLIFKEDPLKRLTRSTISFL